MRNVKTLLMVSLLAGLAAPVLADEKDFVKDENEIVSGVADLADINLPGDEVGNPLIIAGLDYSYGPADISTWNNIYTGTVWGYAFRTGDDVVFKYTPAVTSTGNSIQTCTGTTFDSVIHLFQGLPAPLGRIGYNDDGCGVQSIISNVTFTAGIDYYIIVESYSASVPGNNFTLRVMGPCIDPGCPAGFNVAYEMEPNCANANGTCATGEPVIENTPLCGMTKADGTKDTDWFVLVLSQKMDVSITVAANCVPMRGYLYSGTCASTVQRATITIAAGATVTSSTVVGLDPGVYFVKVEPQGTTGFPCTGNYHYGLTVNSTLWVDPCSFYTCTPLNAAGSYFGNTAGKPNVAGNAAPDDFYCLTAYADCAVTLSTCSPNTLFAPSNDTYLRLWSAGGPCGGGVQLAFNDDDPLCEDGGIPVHYRSTLTYSMVAGQSYVVQVEGFSSNAGPYELTITGDCVTVDAHDVPVAFNLGQNVPNPFNPTTTISFSMPETGAASLKVFDVAGRTVATLIDGAVERGQHTVTFDAGNLTSGVYFYTLETNGSVETKKMILMK